MYLYQSQNATHTTIGSTIRLVISEKKLPLNFADVADFEVITKTEEYVTIDISKPIRKFNFSPSADIDIFVFPNISITGNNICDIPLKYIWLSC